MARRRRLTAGEVAEAAVLADLGVVAILLGAILPALGPALTLAGAAPFAVAARRRGVRPAMLAVSVAAVLLFLIGGIGLALQGVVFAAIGVVCGANARRGRGRLMFWALAVGCVCLPVALGTTLMLALLRETRTLVFDQAAVAAQGIANFCTFVARALDAAAAAAAQAPVVASAVAAGGVGVVAVLAWRSTRLLRDRRVRVAAVAACTAVACAAVFAGPAADAALLRAVGRGAVSLATFTVRNWSVVVPVAMLAWLILVSVAIGEVASPVLDRIGRVLAVPREVVEAAGGPGVADADDVPGPVPVRLREVSVIHAGRNHPALTAVDLAVPARGFVGVLGANGSGKSTLVGVLAGLVPAGTAVSGEIVRPGAAAPGAAGGTAVVWQRPDTQILGVRVRDDVVWGLPRADAAACDVDGWLARVGLDPGVYAERETAGLSGGELQRLAVAAALARRPALLLADEATAMLDPPGRRAVSALLHTVSADMAVVAVTHLPDEVAGAVELVRLAGGRVLAPRQPLAPATHSVVPRRSGRGRPRPDVALRLVLRGVGHTYAAGTPWANRALRGVDVEIRAGERVLVAGRNGSGKSTLAWILAGLLAPTEGTARIIDPTDAEDAVTGGTAVDAVRHAVAITFQQARLSLLRARVRDDVAYGAVEGGCDVDAALHACGLDPEQFGARNVDALSGGEQRRVAIAGALARCAGGFFVLDEPLAGLDAQSRLSLAATLADVPDIVGAATIVVSHDFAQAAEFCDRIILLDAGRVVRDAPLDAALAESLTRGDWDEVVG